MRSDEVITDEIRQILARDFGPYPPNPYRRAVPNSAPDGDPIPLGKPTAIDESIDEWVVDADRATPVDLRSTDRYISAWKRSFARGRAKTWFHVCNEATFVTKNGDRYDRPNLEWLKGHSSKQNGNFIVEANSIGRPNYAYQVHEGSEYVVSLSTNLLIIPETGEYDLAGLVPVDARANRAFYAIKIGSAQVGPFNLEWGAKFTISLIQYHRVDGDLEPLHYYPRIVESAPPHLAPSRQQSGVGLVSAIDSGPQTDAFSANSARVYLEKTEQPYAGGAYFAVAGFACRYTQTINSDHMDPTSYIRYRTLIANPLIGMSLVR